MRSVIQRVLNARVEIKGLTAGKIEKGILVLLGICEDDCEEDVDYMIKKIMNLRIFEDTNGKFNLSLLDIKGEILVVSQFTLYGDCRKGRRPSFGKASSPDKAIKLYDVFLEKANKYGLNVQAGKFQEEMNVELVNNGPVTLLIDSKKQF